MIPFPSRSHYLSGGHFVPLWPSCLLLFLFFFSLRISFTANSAMATSMGQGPCMTLFDWMISTTRRFGRMVSLLSADWPETWPDGLGMQLGLLAGIYKNLLHQARSFRDKSRDMHGSSSLESSPPGGPQGWSGFYLLRGTSRQLVYLLLLSPLACTCKKPPNGLVGRAPMKHHRRRHDTGICLLRRPRRFMQSKTPDRVRWYAVG